MRSPAEFDAAAHGLPYAQSMGSMLLDRLLAFPRALLEFLGALPERMGPVLLTPSFIAVFLLFTLLIWIGMSADDNDSVAGGFLKAGLIAFVSVVLLFSIFVA